MTKYVPPIEGDASFGDALGHFPFLSISHVLKIKIIIEMILQFMLNVTPLDTERSSSFSENRTFKNTSVSAALVGEPTRKKR
jgi:hypothetical protein